MDNGVSKCGRKTALSIFFAISIIAFTFCLLSLVSPSWQYVYLENGRTEHQHGLWLDCKRDYSFDYGRTREYYETLYRRDFQGSPFDIFFLPPLQCVYKFDYYIDPEDLYDHDHDENRIQNDAYQHLFLGWKIAALSACGVAVLFSAAALILGICSFCHRTFICASTVLVTISAILSTIGVIVFYMWANYQDNKVIKEEADTIYEQVLGWAFYFQIIGVILQWLTSMIGCCVTSISFSKGRAKLVKIEVMEGDDSMLLSNQPSTNNFKRSFSAIYRVDSQALRQWEREYMKSAKKKPALQTEKKFERTASMPNFCKKQKKSTQKRERQMAKSNTDIFSSASNITETTHSGSSNTLETHRVQMTSQASRSVEQPGKLKSALKTPQQQRRPINENDVTYEYIPCDGSVGVSTFLGGRTPSQNMVYDSVYEQIEHEDYLEPNSARAKSSTSTLNIDNGRNKKVLLPTMPLAGSSQSIPVSNQKTTVINDIGRPSSSSDLLRDNRANFMKTEEQKLIDERSRRESLEESQRIQLDDKDLHKSAHKQPTPLKSTELQLNIRDFGINLSNSQNGYCTEIKSDRYCEEPPHLQRYEHGPCTSSAFNDSTTSVKYTKLEKTATKPSSELLNKYMKIDRSKVVKIDVKNGFEQDNPGFHTYQTADTQDTNQFLTNDKLTDDVPSPPKIAINTFGFTGRSSQRSITNLTFYPAISTVAEVFERANSDILNLKSPSNTSKKPQMQQIQKKLLASHPDEVDRSIGSSTLLENDVRDLSTSYVNDAELRLNLFMSDRVKSQDETTV